MTGGIGSLASVDDVMAALDAQDYLADELLATSLFLALQMRRPLLLEGEAGVGKTEIAKATAAMLGSELIRLQCYEGIDASQAVYEWDHARQLLHVRAVEAEHRGASAPAVEGELYTDRFLIRRPILRAISSVDPVDPADPSGPGGPAGAGVGGPPVLLIDEVDRADDEFEAFLLEVLSDWSVTIPEYGTIRAEVPPVVIITSNRTRDVHDALKRRCLYHWVEHPHLDRELAILRRRVPGISSALSEQVARATAALRDRGLYKPPGVAESIDWASALATLGCATLDPQVVEATMGTVVKYREDQARIRAGGFDEIVAAASAS